MTESKLRRKKQINMKKLYPLKFEDSCNQEAVVTNGFLAENSLDDIVDTYLGNILGDKVFRAFRGLFPIAVEICDILKQSHLEPINLCPNNEIAEQRYGCQGKEIMLYVLEAEENAELYIGFKRSLTATDIYNLCQEGRIIDAMNDIAPQQGEIFYIRPGVPFCLGRGAKYLKVEQNSPVLFNIDNLEELVESLDFIELGKYIPEYAAPEESLLRVERIAISKPQTIFPDQGESFMVIIGLQGRVSIKTSDVYGVKENNAENYQEVGKEEVLLIPQQINQAELTPIEGQAEFLRVYVNLPEEEPFEIESNDDDCHCDEHGHHHHNCNCGEDNHHHGNEENCN